MSKRLLSLVSMLLVLTLVFAACAPAEQPPADPPANGGEVTDPADPGDVDVPPTAGGEITLVNNKVEIDGALRDFAALYEEQTGVRVNIQSFGGESPYAPALAAMFAGGTEPEIFVFEGYTGFAQARDAGRVTDLSDQPWVQDTDYAFFDEDGRVVGFPVAVEGWGLGYNVAILEQAGIDTSTLTNRDAIAEAFASITDQLDELGLEAVVSMAAGPGMTWVTGLHGFNAYLALGLDYYDTTFIDMLNAGEIDRERMTYFAEYYQMIFQHSIPGTLTTGGYDQQLGDFALGRTAFIHQGNWIDPALAELGVDFEMGYIPHAFLPEDTPGIFVGAPSWYLVNALSNNPEAAIDFLNFMATTEEGHRYMVTYAGAVPAFDSVTIVPEGPLSMAVNDWSSRGQIYAWHQNDMPDGFGMGTLGPIFTLLAAGQITVEEFVDQVEARVAELG